ncbi:predicted protein [Histoplasma mississippiense (nom. inval.)]|uniref:predicted protein n=1 Tax=Ajellomyces capsulatus (strain NAm1 / WU24) TaxID=2059318 RepID=UPI000157C810|nr:predicted protein [Histoplasma mississippiense (nom. inval.)]EDN09379.1 predicted protein [Histoplasma mississippiense (nom. inval.)]
MVTTTMFIDIKGAFDCVSLSQMIKTLIKLRMPKSLIKWVVCFMSKRTIQLLFDGMRQDITDIETNGNYVKPKSSVRWLDIWFNVPEKTLAAPVFQKPPEGHGDVATLEKTQLIAKDFSELRIHFWPDRRSVINFE